MNKNQALLAAACLVITLVGCQTDDGVQKGYLTPQQASSDTSDQTASADSTSSERLTPPSVTQEAEQTASTEASTPPPTESNVSAPAPTEPESTPAPSNETASASSSSTGSDRSPDALAKNQQRPGGKVGAGRPVPPPSTASRDDDREQAEPSRVERREEPEAREEEKDEDREDEQKAPAAAAGASTVSSNLSSGSTRIAEPTGSVRGVVVSVNGKAKFVVVKYNYRAIPSVGKVLSVSRNGVKVGQIKVTKPVKPPHSTADIIDGDVQRGDIVE